MKARFVFACAAAGIALSAFGATTASADDQVGTIGFSPEWGRPGDTLTISGTCKAADFNSTINSDVLDATELVGMNDGNGGFKLKADARVKAGAAPGWWPVSFMCGDTMVQGQFKVSALIGLPKAEVTVDPQKGVPGAKVNIGVLCDQPVPVTSKALEVGKLEKAPEYDVDNPVYGATATVKDVKPGVYEVATNCGVAEITTKFTVLGSTPAPAAKAQVPVKPKGAADTGSLDRPATKTATPASAPASEEGSSTGLLVLGGSALAALGAAGGVGTWAYRRRQRA